MARKKEAKVEVVNEVAISKTLVLVTYSDGTSEIRFKLTSDELEKLVAAVSPADDEEEDEEEDDNDEDDEEEDEEEDDNDEDDEDEEEDDNDEDDEDEDIEKFRKAIAKELGITLPKAKKETKAKGKKGKK